MPDAQQSTVNNLFRLPLNMLVAVGTMLSDHLPAHHIFAICAAAHALATLCQLRLAWLGRKGGGGGGVAQESAQAAGPKKVRAATPRARAASPKARAASPKARAASPARSSRDRRSPQRKKKTL